VHHWLTPVFSSWGAPGWAADVAGFVLALVIVTFLHLVVGEMAPKSWAIAHPERSAIMLALPMRAFMAVFRPVLIALNHSANWMLRKVGVTPVDELAAGQDPDTLRHLVEHSATVGTLDQQYSTNLMSALELQALTVGDLVTGEKPRGVASDADPGAIQAESRATGHLRLLVLDGAEVRGVVHVRDSLSAGPGATAADLMRPALTLSSAVPVYEALRTMRETREHLAVVLDADGNPVGLITLTDGLDRLMPTSEAAA
jgi:CBS domain containing-hemolysin-like protein